MKRPGPRKLPTWLRGARPHYADGDRETTLSDPRRSVAYRDRAARESLGKLRTTGTLRALQGFLGDLMRATNQHHVTVTGNVQWRSRRNTQAPINIRHGMMRRAYFVPPTLHDDYTRPQ